MKFPHLNFCQVYKMQPTKPVIYADRYAIPQLSILFRRYLHQCTEHPGHLSPMILGDILIRVLKTNGKLKIAEYAYRLPNQGLLQNLPFEHMLHSHEFVGKTLEENVTELVDVLRHICTCDNCACLFRNMSLDFEIALEAGRMEPNETPTYLCDGCLQAAMHRTADDNCCICHEPLQSAPRIALPKCTHQLHQKCYVQYKIANGHVVNTCPLCRKPQIEEQWTGGWHGIPGDL